MEDGFTLRHTHADGPPKREKSSERRTTAESVSVRPLLTEGVSEILILELECCGRPKLLLDDNP